MAYKLALMPHQHELDALREAAKRYDPRGVGFDLRQRVIKDFVTFMDEQGITFAGPQDLMDHYYVVRLYLTQVSAGKR